MRLIFSLIRRMIALVLLPLLNLLALLRRRFDRGSPRWLLLQLDGHLTDLPPRSPPALLGLLQRERPLVLIELDEVLRAAARDPHLTGVVCRLRQLEGGWASFWELRQSLLRFRASGKKVLFYFEQADNRAYWLATCADEVLMAPQGNVMLLGLRAEVTFFRRLFDQVGITPDFLRVGQYKSFAETFTEEEMTPAMQESLSAIIDDLSSLLTEGIASGRNMSIDAVRALVDRGPFTAKEALEAGLIDTAVYPDELKTRLEAAGRKPRWISTGRYARRLAWRRRLEAPIRPLPRIAVVRMDGNIVDHAGRQGPFPATAAQIDPRTYGTILSALREDPSIAGVVLRVNSPGGSALASDLLWRSVTRLRDAKPVVVSMGNVAASGGYYLSAPATKILATPGTLTGSIGVVAGKFSLGQLYERLGIRKSAIERGRHAGMHTESRPFTATERERIQQEIDTFYGVFVEKVQEGRKLDQVAAASASQGRVWSGPRGREIGLVDSLGGMREAIDEVRGMLKLDRVQMVAISPSGAPALGRLLSGALYRLGLQPGALFSGASAGPAAELLRALSKLAAQIDDESRLMAIMPFSIDVR